MIAAIRKAGCNFQRAGVEGKTASRRAERAGPITSCRIDCRAAGITVSVPRTMFRRCSDSLPTRRNGADRATFNVYDDRSRPVPVIGRCSDDDATVSLKFED